MLVEIRLWKALAGSVSPSLSEESSCPLIPPVFPVPSITPRHTWAAILVFCDRCLTFEQSRAGSYHSGRVDRGDRLTLATTLPCGSDGDHSCQSNLQIYWPKSSSPYVISSLLVTIADGPAIDFSSKTISVFPINGLDSPCEMIRFVEILRTLEIVQI